MLGLKFQDNAADFGAGLDAFIAALGSAAGDESSIREGRTRHNSLRQRGTSRKHRRVGGYQASPRKRQSKRHGTPGEGAAVPALRLVESYVASLAAALGFEAAQRV